MNYKDFIINISYKSVGEETISDIINPLLEHTKVYKRSVGFFSSSAFNFISEGINKLASNGGKIYLVTSPELSQEDVDAINNGYERKQMYKEKFLSEFEKSTITLDDEKLKLLSDLIVEDILEIKIVKKKNCGMYHDKLAILTDFDGNSVVFQGSNNESANGYDGNYEKVRVYKSWFDFEGRIEDETREFESIWNDNNGYLDVYEFPDAVKKAIIKIREDREKNPKPVSDTPKEPFELRKYQEEARDAWVNNGFNGFFVMATGTGKTITSLYSIRELLKDNEIFTVIAVPYKHLVNQWYEDAIKILPNCMILKAYSEISNWDANAINSIYYNKFNEKKNVIIITTIKSFSLEKFDKVVSLVKTKKLLVVDEAHNFINKIDEPKYNYDYKLGLSATPVFGTDSEKTNRLLNFFGGRVYNLPIEDAIGKFLVNYEYHPIFVNSTSEEEENFKLITSKMRGCFDKSGALKDKDKLVLYHKARLRIISMASEKIDGLSSYINEVNKLDHFIIYCSDGKMYDDYGEELKHIKYVLNLMNNMGFKPSKFTADENMSERMSLINNFNKGYISSLVAIRCLDEGINIPSIESALILSSNDNYREFVQRRGRILRKFGDKKIAHIYDVIVLPSLDCPNMAEIEFRRYYEYAKLSVEPKRTELLNQLDTLNKYGLTYDDIKFNNDYLEGGDLDD